VCDDLRDKTIVIGLRILLIKDAILLVPQAYATKKIGTVMDVIRIINIV